ncbi:hypothetical protein BGZ92_008349 [Podila epicladia]|nr:hypothetical protein BGZ92_008349 [Podila epicladia]
MKNSQGDTLRIHLSKSRDFVGIRSTRCQRKHNQDRYKVLVLNPPTLSPELAAAEASINNGTTNGTAPQIKSTEGTQMDADEKTLFYFAIFDGHGGSHTADYLTANLDEYIEQAQPEMVAGVVKELRKLGGSYGGDEGIFDEDDDPYVQAYRRRRNATSPLPEATTSYFGTDRSEYQSLFLREEDRLLKKQAPAELPPPPTAPTTMTLEQRLFLSFLQCDTELIRDKYQDGSTASIVVVQSKGAFWDTKEDLELTVAHVGDTKVLLCEAPRGESVQLTTDHHPDAVVEAERIRKMAAYVSADSFGENMFLGQLANTRALGDVAMKQFGVSAEPELVRRTVKANEAAFMVLISDGISSVMSNQEVVDCVKLEDNPTQAAANVLNLAEQLGAEDNCTVMVVKLPAWGTPMPDLSKELREYRWQSEAQQSRARRR